MTEFNSIWQQDKNGTSKDERLLNALLPDYVKVDERKMVDLMAFTAEFAESVKYYNHKRQEVVPQNWTKFFLKDISVFLATILSFDLEELDRKHQSIVDSISHGQTIAEKKIRISDLFAELEKHAKTLNYWYIHAKTLNDTYSGEGRGIELELKNAIVQKLKVSYKRLIELKEKLGIPEVLAFAETNIKLPEFDSIWNIEVKAYTTERSEMEMTLDELYDGVKNIRILYRTFHNVTAYLMKRAQVFLTESLESKDNHRPDVALFIAFLNLFKELQADQNQLTKRHLDYYYSTILKLKERTISPDQVNVFFEPAQHISKYELEKGTRMIGENNEDGIPLTYELVHDLLITRASIASLKTLYVSKNPLIGIGSTYKLVANIFSATHADSKDGAGTPFSENAIWPTFGEEQFDKAADERKMEEANIGFAISSPVLEMTEGEREVKIRFVFSKNSINTLYMLIKDISRNEKISRPDAFRRVFEDTLDIQLSVVDGWFTVDVYEVLFPEDWSKGELEMVFSLDASQPAIGKQDVDLVEEYFGVELPLLKVQLRKKDSVYAYSFLRDLELEQIIINVEVKNIKNLNLYNDTGQLDPNQPFQPFGPIPKQGSYLIIGSGELFKKELADLSFDIEWFDLVQEEGGFESYYAAYNKGITNQSFEVALSALSENTFSPKPGQSNNTHKLFSYDDDKKRLNSTIRIENVNVNDLDIAPNPDFDDSIGYSTASREGFLKLELTNPPMAFGNSMFQKLFTETVSQNALQELQKGLFSRFSRSPKPIPNAPYVPMIKSLSLSYKALARIDILSIGAKDKNRHAPEEIFHIYPFGKEKIYDKSTTKYRSLFPIFEEDGSMFIGLQDFEPPVPISFLFQLDESRQGDTFSQQPIIKWAYLANNLWHELKPEQLLLDNTDGFTTSGVIMLDVPTGINKNNSILSNDLHWLRASVEGDTSILSHTRLVKTQAGHAKWVPNENKDHLSSYLPENSIVGLETEVSEINKVNQPFPSFDGRGDELREEFYTRVSERLRHKNRAITGWDFERLVLDNFPDIHQVKCLRYNGFESYLEEGEVVVVVVPESTNTNGYFEPKVNYSKLKSIKDFLRSYASPFANIEVRNPVYEKLKITCGVIFTKGSNNGNYLQKLNDEIQQFVCPWLYGGDHELDLGGSINKNAILSFIEKRDYVKFITKFSVVQVFQDEAGFDLTDTARDVSSSPVIAASTPWSVLVPLPRHPIAFLDHPMYQSPEAAGIDSMIISTDFIVKDLEEEEIKAVKSIPVVSSVSVDDEEDSNLLYMVEIEI